MGQFTRTAFTATYLAFPLSLFTCHTHFNQAKKTTQFCKIVIGMSSMRHGQIWVQLSRVFVCLVCALECATMLLQYRRGLIEKHSIHTTKPSRRWRRLGRMSLTLKIDFLVKCCGWPVVLGCRLALNSLHASLGIPINKDFLENFTIKINHKHNLMHATGTICSNACHGPDFIRQSMLILYETI